MEVIINKEYERDRVRLSFEDTQRLNMVIIVIGIIIIMIGLLFFGTI
jgi:hypothetical protein